MLKNLPKYYKFFFLFIILETIGLIITESLAVISFEEKQDTFDYHVLLFYFLLLDLTLFFMVGFAWFLMKTKNLYQLIPFVFIRVILTGWSIYQLIVLIHMKLIIIFFCIVIFFDVMYLFFIKKIFSELQANFWSQAGGTETMHIKEESQSFYKLFLVLSVIQPLYNISCICFIWLQLGKFQEIPQIPVTVLLAISLLVRISLLYFARKSSQGFELGLHAQLSAIYSTSLKRQPNEKNSLLESESEND
ncbi:hypothetical protein M0812_12871 [Anaeramoeba flamelloides]|uniref:Uncharacterized protein n=1 Tax=Anaeramoeba flamelloides TaxID=1746091 RepID=A0AAV7ZFR0_9EUKA|nr:hypothetical protein M0812_12871 [Anaeramoeba flamelloides]